MVSNPPIHSAHLVIEILSNESLRAQWFRETKLMADRIKLMRIPPPILHHSNVPGTQLKKGVEDAGSHRDWSHITSQIGITSTILSLF